MAMPMALDDSFSVRASGTTEVDAVYGVLTNDASDSPMTAAVASVPSHRTLALNADGSFAYTPTGSFVGEDGFTDVVTVAARRSATASVTLEVQQVTTGTVNGRVFYDEDRDGIEHPYESGPSHG